MKKKLALLIALSVLGPVGITSASIDKNLKFGQRDSEVKELQEFLITKGLLKTTPSTYFGGMTFSAVKAYQKSIGVSPTGFVGVLTREKINADILSAKKDSTVATQTNTAILGVGSNPAENSIYDSNDKLDLYGRKVLITQTPNYKFTNLVRAKMELNGRTVDGNFNKDLKIFTSDDETFEKARLAEIEVNRLNGIYQSTVSTTTALTPQSKPEIYITAVRASYSTSNNNALFAYELRNTSDKLIQVNSVSYHLDIDGRFFHPSIPVIFTQTNTANSGKHLYSTNITGHTTFQFERPIVIFPKEVAGFTVEYSAQTVNPSIRDVSETKISIDAIGTTPDSSIKTLPIKNSAVLRAVR